MARTPEGNLKDYLKARIVLLGGSLRFLKWVGRTGAMDTRAMFPNGRIYIPTFGFIVNCFVETKTKNGRLSVRQEREIADMRANGEVVIVLYATVDVDRYFPDPKTFERP